MSKANLGALRNGAVKPDSKERFNGPSFGSKATISKHDSSCPSDTGREATINLLSLSSSSPVATALTKKDRYIPS